MGNVDFIGCPYRAKGNKASAKWQSRDTWGARKARLNGTVAHTTIVFGCALAGLVVQDVAARAHARQVP